MIGKKQIKPQEEEDCVKQNGKTSKKETSTTADNDETIKTINSVMENTRGK